MLKFFSKIIRKWQLILYTTFFFGACVFFVSTLFVPKYQSEVVLLISPKNIAAQEATVSLDYFSGVFSEIVYTEIFIDDVLSSSLGIEKQFSADSFERKREWEKEVNIEAVADAGILKVEVLDESRSDARKIAQAIAQSFMNNPDKYQGLEVGIEVKLVDGPATSTKPVFPNVILNTILGALGGLILSLIIAIFFDSFDFVSAKEDSSVSFLVENQLKKQLRERTEKKKLVYDDFEPEDFGVFPAEEEESLEEEDFEEGELDDEVAEEKEENFGQKIEEKKAAAEEALVEQDGPSKESAEQTPDFEGSMIDEEGYKESFSTKKKKKKESVIEDIEKIPFLDQEDDQEDDLEDDFKENPEEETAFEQDEDDGEVKKSSPNNFLDRLYKKSIFSDEKLSKLKDERTDHHKHVEEIVFDDEPYLPIVESVKKVTPEETAKEKPESESDSLGQKMKKAEEEEILSFSTALDGDTKPQKKENQKSSHKKASAPENLPIFLSEESNDVEEGKIDEIDQQTEVETSQQAKEFSAIEHVELSDEPTFEIKEVVEPAINLDQVEAEKEVSEEDARNKLNKLMEGEMDFPINEAEPDGEEQMKTENFPDVDEQGREQIELSQEEAEKEPSEGDVKDRLNKLIQGNL